MQSDPECDYGTARKQKNRKFNVKSGQSKQLSSPVDSVYDVPPKPRRKTTFSPNLYSQTLGRLEGRKQVQRLAQYERYFEELLTETSTDHPDFDELGRIRSKVSQLVSATNPQHSELDRVQELFPSDHLALHHKDPSYPRMKSLLRKRSAPAYRLQRALSAKSLRPSLTDQSATGEDVCDRGAMPGTISRGPEAPSPADTPDTTVKRHFMMEAPVQFTLALQSQERHLFLFNDLLLVAKARSGGNFKLKEKLRVSELWLTDCLDEVAEVTKDASTSFVLGWPTTNVVATFTRAATRDLWYSKLSQIIAEQRLSEPKSVNIQITYYDQANSIDFCKTMSVDASMTARDCVSAILNSLELGPSPGAGVLGSAASSEYQLWVRTSVEDAPYPLIGHELPFSIKMNFIRECIGGEGECGLPATPGSGSAEISHSTNTYSGDSTHKCQFILRHVRKNSLGPSPSTGVSMKKKKQSRKSPIRIHKVFRRTNSKTDSVDSAISACSGGLLFGQPLDKLCQHEPIPKPVLDMLMQLFMVGPFTVGIFRKSANARMVKEMRAKLDTELEVSMESVNICVVACLVKDFLRSLPDAVLGSDLYDDWRELAEIGHEAEKVQRVRELCSRLPTSNVTLLCHFLCVLYHIAARSHHNLMSSANLSVCVGPSLLAPGNPAQVMSPEHSKLIPAVIQFLIDKCPLIFGEEVLQLFGPPPEKEVRIDSGAEESDSVNSSGGVRRDDSSIDSLERELLGENEPLPRKDKMSMTNLSRDSGLTMSDSQLYTTADDETEESASNSSGHSTARTAKAVGPAGPGVYSSGRSSGCSGMVVAPRRRQLGPTFSSPAVTVHTAPATFVDNGNGATTREAPASRSYTYLTAPECTTNAIYSQLPASSRQSGAPYSQQKLDSVPRRYVSNFQRQDWTRQRHLLRRSGHSAHSVIGVGGENGSRQIPPSVSPEAVSAQLPTTGRRVMMRRSNSEESLLNGYGGYSGNSGSFCGQASGSAGADTAVSSVTQSHAAEEDDEGSHWPLPAMLRSRSAHHIVDRRWCRLAGGLRTTCGTAAPADWAGQSRSTLQLSDEVDRSYDSSTLSDDDSTPHVSRSNSRAKDSCALANDTWERVYGGSDSGSHTSRTGSFSTVRSIDTSSLVSTCSPPSYEATLHNRRGRLQQQQQRASCGSLVTPSLVARSTTRASSASELVRASPVCTVEQTGVDTIDAIPPLPPKTDIPPLPPKQKVPLRRLGGSSGIGGDAGSVVSVSGSRLRQLPPVHVVTTPWKSRGGSVYVRSCSNASEGDKELASVPPPALPPKERTVIQIECEYEAPCSVSRVGKRQVTRREVQTQTESESPVTVAPPSGQRCQQSLRVREPHVTLVEIDSRGPLSDNIGAAPGPPVMGPSERRGRNRRRDRQAALRARSQTSLTAGDADCFRLTTPSAVSDSRLEWCDPTLPAISWSVSKLRAMFANNNSSSGRSDSADDQTSSVCDDKLARLSSRTGHRRLHRCSANHLSMEDVFSLPDRRSNTPARANGLRRRSDSGGSGGSSYGEESYV